MITNASIAAGKILISSSIAAARDARKANDYFDNGWQTALSLAVWAKKLAPLDADARELHARLLRSRSRVRNFPGRETNSFTVSGSYASTLALRPHDGELWMSYTMALNSEGDTFASVHDALHRSSSLAPYRPFVLLNDIELHLLAWDELSAADRRHAKARIGYAAGVDPFTLAAASVYANTQDRLRPLLTDDRVIKILNRAIEKKNNKRRTYDG